jgi:toxin ParE1/3/4
MASVFATRAFEATDRLVDFPQSGRVVPELGQPNIREVFVFSYRIIYRHTGDMVQILTVHHGARPLDPGSM